MVNVVELGNDGTTKLDWKDGCWWFMDNQLEPAVKPAPSNYVPSVGDVVEWWDGGRNGKGILFKSTLYVGELGLAYGDNSGWDKISNIAKTRKIGRCEAMPTDPLNYSDICDIAKAYFSKPKPYVPVVGDVVEFEYNGKTRKGILAYSDGSNRKLRVVNKNSGSSVLHNSLDFFGELNKVSHTNLMDNLTNRQEIKAAFKAYFSLEPTD